MTTEEPAMLEPITECLVNYKPEPIKWLWPGRVPRGKVTLLCGDPGLGKSFITMDMAARVSNCQDWPDGDTPLKGPAGVLLMSAEDDPADTIRPRIEAAGGDPSRIVLLKGVRRGQHGTKIKSVCLDVDVDAIEEAIVCMERPRLVIIDPISAYMGETDSHNNAEVRGVLAQLSELAAKHGPAIVCVTHLNKAPGGKAVYRAMGSLAFTAAARIAWLVTKMPGDERQRAMVLMKSNLPDVGKGLAFQLLQEKKSGFVQWLDTSLEVSADFLEQSQTDAECASTEACEFLKAAVAQGPRPATEIIRDAGQLGIPVIALRRAKKMLGVKSMREGGNDRPWMWGGGGQ